MNLVIVGRVIDLAIFGLLITYFIGLMLFGFHHPFTAVSEIHAFLDNFPRTIFAVLTIDIHMKYRKA